jgi:hypothetical protein
MLTLARRVFSAFLFDEDMGPRWLAMLLASVGGILATGGNVPGTEIVVPGVADFQFLGPWMLLGSFAIVSVTTALPKNQKPELSLGFTVESIAAMSAADRAKLAALLKEPEAPKP